MSRSGSKFISERRYHGDDESKNELSGEEVYNICMEIEDDQGKVDYMATFMNRGQAQAMGKIRGLHFMQKGKTEEITERSMEILSNFENRVILLFAGLLPLDNAVKLVNTFTCTDILSVAGWAVEYVAPVKKEEGKEYPPDVVMVSRNGKSPPIIGGPMAKFTKGNEVMYVPIVNKNINTNYFPAIEGLAFATFSAGLAISVAAVCSYVEAKDGKSSVITITPAVTELLGLNRMISPPGLSAALMGILDRMADVDRKNGVSRDYTWRGVKLASEVYNFLITETQKPGSDMLAKWISWVNMGIKHPGGVKKFLKLELGTSGNKVITVNYLAPLIPNQIDNRTVDLVNNKVATLKQAWSALAASRSIRGENESERAVNSRYANTPIRVSYQANEMMRVRTDYEQFYTGAKVVVIWSNKNEVVATVQIMSAMLMSGFSGTVRISSSMLKTPGIQKDVVDKQLRKEKMAVATSSSKDKPYKIPDKEVKYNYRGSKYFIEFYHPGAALEEIAKGADLFLDLEVAAQDGGKFDHYNEAYATNVPVIVRKLDKLGIRYVLPVKMYADIDAVLLVGEGDKTTVVRFLYAGTQFSNLVCYMTNDRITAWQNYDLNSFTGRKHFLAATIMVNIARNNYNITALTPNFLLEDYGYQTIRIKCGGLSAITSNIHTYSSIYKERIDSYSMEELQDIADTSSDVALVAEAKTAMRQMINNNATEEEEDADDKGKEQEGSSSSATKKTKEVANRVEELCD